MLYQATRTFGDYDNGLEIPVGCYVETDCVKWVSRFGPILRPLSAGETAKGKIVVVKNTVEDVFVQPSVVEPVVTEEVVEEIVNEDAALEEEVVETTPLRRKIKPPRNN
jgi:hypothetical protein